MYVSHVSMGRVATLVGVHDVPQAVRSLTTFPDPDYVDMFTVATPLAADRSPEAWARAILEQAPLASQNAREFWRLMGLRLGPQHSSDHVQGWWIAARGDTWLRLETASWYLSAQAVCLVNADEVSLSLSLRYDRAEAAVVWALVSGQHQRAVPVMLHQAVKLVTAEAQRAPT
jgi:hypothetical protein